MARLRYKYRLSTSTLSISMLSLRVGSYFIFLQHLCSIFLKYMVKRSLINEAIKLPAKMFRLIQKKTLDLHKKNTTRVGNFFFLNHMSI